jgi:hypothetical protein
LLKITKYTPETLNKIKTVLTMMNLFLLALGILLNMSSLRNHFPGIINVFLNETIFPSYSHRQDNAITLEIFENNPPTK